MTEKEKNNEEEKKEESRITAGLRTPKMTHVKSSAYHAVRRVHRLL